jgi:murein DD-endopeptidase MepM/ murein hydrolase activator NlpD
MRKWRNFRREFKEFLQAWRQFLFWRLYRLFAVSEKLKKLIAQVLYRQRGRFARPFVHTAMGGIVAMAITLAPVLASSFPGVQNNLPDDALAGNQVLEVESDETSTQVSDKVRDQVLKYTVQPGDTISEIADKFGISTDTVRWENNLLTADAIKPGQTLGILPVSGVRVKVSRGETIYSIAKKYSANPQAIVDFPFNNFSDNETFSLDVGQDLIVPDGKKPNEIPWSPTLYVAQSTPNAGSVSAVGSFIWPIGGSITQRFSWYHTGLDIAAPFGTPILAADAGTVMVAGWPDNSGYGNRVVIDHHNGYQTWYGHMSKVLVSAGQTVNRGDRIGLEGSTGRSTGPHCHFEIRKGGVRLNPLSFLK